MFTEAIKKKLKGLAVSVLCLLAGGATLSAQQKVTITGNVIDETGFPMIGAGIIELGTNDQNGAITDLDGNYSLTVPVGSTVEFRMIGYQAAQAVIKGAGTYNMQLQPDNLTLEGTVVVGYGVQKKSVVTGSISQVKAEDITSSSITQVEQALQGKTSGVQILSSSGSPGSTMKIRIRGYSSNGSSDPLYIVDGLRTTDISNIDPSNIESMEVLKDGASAAIYGAEGGNGVVLITTKAGKAGKTEINYNFQYSIQSLGKVSDQMNASQYLDYMQTAGLIDSSVTLDGTDTDWVKEMFEASPMQKHSLSISGGNEKVTYFGSLGYLQQEGIVVGNQDNFKRISGMFSGSVQAKKWLKMTSSISLTRAVKKSFSENDESRGVISNALMMDPLTPVYYTDSNNLPSHVQNLLDAGNNLMTNSDGYYYGISQYVTGECINPMVQKEIAQVEKTFTAFQGNVGFDITPFKGFTFSSKAGVRYFMSNTHEYDPSFYYNSEMYNDYASVSEDDVTRTYWQWENYASYTRTFNDVHNMTVMVGASLSSNDYKSVSASGYPLIEDSENYAELNYISSQTGSNVSGYTMTDRKASFFGRVNYDYKEKYLFEATLRADAAGLSILPKDQRWGVFPAVSAGWVISREDWFPKEGPVNFLKIRGSWGQNGSLSNLGEYSYAATIASSGYYLSYLTWSYSNSSYTYPLANGTYATASSPSTLGNYNLTWETSEQIDFGLEARAFNDRLNFTFDYYRKETKDLITENTPALEAGNDASPVNGGTVLNYGFEFDLSWKDKVGEVSYGISANLSTVHNEVTYLDESISRLSGATLMTSWTATAFEVGYPVWYFRGYKTDGLTSDGDLNIVDVNGDGSITTDDYTMIGSAIPDFTYGITLNAAYKGFDLMVFASGSYGNDVLYGARRPDRLTTNKLATFYEDAWTSGNTSAKYPSVYYQVNNTDFWYSDKMVFDGSYLKIKQIQLGYTFPKKWMSKVDITNLRIYVSLDDFFTITSYPGMDPESSGGTDSYTVGIDRGFFPNAKKIMFGASLTF